MNVYQWRQFFRTEAHLARGTKERWWAALPYSLSEADLDALNLACADLGFTARLNRSKRAAYVTLQRTPNVNPDRSGNFNALSFRSVGEAKNAALKDGAAAQHGTRASADGRGEREKNLPCNAQAEVPTTVAPEKAAS